jgi:uncharacterized membrane protein YvbJ
MRCPNCGHENPVEAKFCGKCANPMQSADSSRVASASAGGVANAGEVSQGLKVGIIVASIFIPLLGIIMGFIFMNDANPAKKAVGKTWLKVGVGIMIFYFIVWLFNHA